MQKQKVFKNLSKRQMYNENKNNYILYFQRDLLVSDSLIGNVA